MVVYLSAYLLACVFAGWLLYNAFFSGGWGGRGGLSDV